VRRLKCYHPNMKRIQSSRTALWYIMCPRDVDLLPIFPESGDKPIASQPLLPRQPACAPLVGGSFPCQPPNMKLIGPLSKELWCDLDRWSMFMTIGSHDRKDMLNICDDFYVYSPLCFWDMGHKMQISWSVAIQPVLPWQPFSAPIVGGWYSC